MDNSDKTRTSSHDSWVVWDLNGYLDGISLIKNEMANVEPEESAKHYFFRGQACYDWNVMPGIFRNGMLAHEYDMIRAAYIRNPRDFGRQLGDQVGLDGGGIGIGLGVDVLVNGAYGRLERRFGDGFLKFLLGRLHQRRVERSADGQAQGAACACGFCQLSGLFHGGFFAADDQLAR